MPFFVIGGRYAVSGAQPAELLLQALQQAWDATQPEPTAASGVGEAGEVCGPDGCALPSS